METGAFEEHLLCPVCREIFRDPVLLLCSHSFCLACLEQYWVHTSSQMCPVCRADFCMEHPPCNRALKNLCEVVLQENEKQVSEDAREFFCSLHGEKLELFCLEDRRLVCGVCLIDDLHIRHTCRPVEETAETLKEDLKTNLKSLQETFKLLKSQKFIRNQKAKHIKSQAEKTEAHIKEEFEQLRHFLRDEEAMRIGALKEEKEQKMKMLDDQIIKINSDLTSLLERIQTIEDEMKTQNVSFLLNYRGPCERYNIPSSRPCLQKLSEGVIDVAKHLGNLKFRVWQKMTDVTQYTPVILDPNTAHPCLHLSGSLTDVMFGQWGQQTRGYPETCDGYTSVLGSEGFSYGTHCWDVDVGDNTSWAIGMISESAITTRDRSPNSGLWRVAYHNGKYGQGESGEFLTPLTVKQKIQRIRVQLNWDGGELTFFSLLTNTHIYTFKHVFTERVFPYFCNVCPSQALRILPVEAICHRNRSVTFFYS
ncbi:tripartite motif containing 35-27 isoform X1 [Triplophysa rosa]|uniref:tripartite motif containing 35-27 isoform X1 n=1 Tax=Triplophysa rosa TaxID=992332 RepID=UPI00254611C8|nr:tripartite motif containing 35-27 isoform X1 [Triplophysa rosa]